MDRSKYKSWHGCSGQNTYHHLPDANKCHEYNFRILVLKDSRCAFQSGICDKTRPVVTGGRDGIDTCKTSFYITKSKRHWAILESTACQLHDHLNGKPLPSPSVKSSQKPFKSKSKLVSPQSNIASGSEFAVLFPPK